MTILYLIRHGESTWNQTGRYQGRIDTELSELGQQQAALLAERLRDIQIDAIYSSPLRRALHTAIAIGSHRGLDIQVEPDLTEIDHGAWNGLLKEEVEKRFGPLLQLWQVSPAKVKMPGGESLSDVSQRANRVIERVVHSHPEQTVVVCSHNAVLKTIVAKAIGLDLNRFWAFDIDNASLSVIDYKEESAYLLLLNDTCFLAELRSLGVEQAL